MRCQFNDDNSDYEDVSLDGQIAFIKEFAFILILEIGVLV
jgi:hypothetical protein